MRRSARGAINFSQEHRGSDRQSTLGREPEEKEEEEGGSQKYKRSEEMKESCVHWRGGVGEKVVITQMGRYAPSIHPMLP